jgi:hypothetical protein
MERLVSKPISAAFVQNTILASRIGSPPSTSAIPVIEPFTKGDYQVSASAERKKIMHTYYGHILVPLFEGLRLSSSKMRVCNQEVIFPVDQIHNPEMINSIITEYFTDLGYKIYSEIRKKGDGSEIVVTLT